MQKILLLCLIILFSGFGCQFSSTSSVKEKELAEKIKILEKKIEEQDKEVIDESVNSSINFTKEDKASTAVFKSSEQVSVPKMIEQQVNVHNESPVPASAVASTTVSTEEKDVNSASVVCKEMATELLDFEEKYSYVSSLINGLPAVLYVQTDNSDAKIRYESQLQSKENVFSYLGQIENAVNNLPSLRFTSAVSQIKTHYLIYTNKNKEFYNAIILHSKLVYEGKFEEARGVEGDLSKISDTLIAELRSAIDVYESEVKGFYVDFFIKKC